MGDACDEPQPRWPLARAVPSPFRVLGLSQQGLSVPLYSQNEVAQPGLGKHQSWIQSQPSAGSLQLAGLGSASSKELS